MKKYFDMLFKTSINHKVLYAPILISLIIGCTIESDTKLDFQLQTHEIIYYPDKHISITFDIQLNDELGPYTLKWYNPDTLKGEGPFTINMTNKIILDFELSDNKNTVERFQHEIIADTIDSLRYDYRNQYIGSYSCKVFYSFKDYTKYYQDTLIVVKSDSFNKFVISNMEQIKYNLYGREMIYRNSNGYYDYPTGSFLGYHCTGLFSKDSIHYTENGPLGGYYTAIYEGIKIKQ